MKRNRSRPETLETIAQYRIRAAASELSDAETELLGGLVRAAVAPMAYLQRVSIYPYLRGATELVQWAHERGYDLELATVLSEDLVWAFLVERPQSGTSEISGE